MLLMLILNLKDQYFHQSFCLNIENKNILFKSLIYNSVSVSYYNVISTDFFIIINKETSKTKTLIFNVITVGNYNRLSRINIRSFYNCGSNLPVMTDDRSLFRPLASPNTLF